MRIVRGVEITIIKKADVNEENIYAFAWKDDICFLCRKDDKFFWKHLCAANMVWYKLYDTIVAAIDGILTVDEYKKETGCEIMEFSSTSELIEWAYEHFKAKNLLKK